MPDGVVGEITAAPCWEPNCLANSSSAKITASLPWAKIAAASSLVSCGPKLIANCAMTTAFTQIRVAHRHNPPDKNDQHQLQTAKQLQKCKLQIACY